VTSWSFLTSHARVLLCIARDPGARLRDIAASRDITERSCGAWNADDFPDPALGTPLAWRSRGGMSVPSASFSKVDANLAVFTPRL